MQYESGSEMAGGKYKVIQQAGDGGTSTVYHVIESKTFIDYAIKVISTSPQTVARVFREATISLKKELKSPHIVEMIEAIPEKNRVLLVMKYYPKGDLQKMIDCCVLYNLSIPEERIVDYARQILEGLSILRKNGIIHRDLKSANILFDEKGSLVITDLGLAKLAAEGVSTQTLAMWSPGFSAPEHVEGRSNLTTAVDIFSCGVIIRQLMAVPQDPPMPFPAGMFSFVEAVKNRAYVAVIPEGKFSSELMSVVDLMLSYNPDLRPSPEALLAHPAFALSPNPFTPSSLQTLQNRVAVLEKEKENALKERDEAVKNANLLKEKRVSEEINKRAPLPPVQPFLSSTSSSSSSPSFIAYDQYTTSPDGQRCTNKRTCNNTCLLDCAFDERSSITRITVRFVGNPSNFDVAIGICNDGVSENFGLSYSNASSVRYQNNGECRTDKTNIPGNAKYDKGDNVAVEINMSSKHCFFLKKGSQQPVAFFNIPSKVRFGIICGWPKETVEVVSVERIAGGSATKAPCSINTNTIMKKYGEK